MAKETTTTKPPKTKPEGQAKRRYRLTAEFKTKQGAVWPSGFQFDATAEEVKRRKMPAEPFDG